MKNMISKIMDNILPIAGGTAGALSQTDSIICNISSYNMIETAILAAIGATVGYLIKLLLDFLFKKKKV